MNIYTPLVTGSFQLPLLSTDPTTSASGQIWFNTTGTGSIKFAVTSGSAIITRIVS